MRILHLEDNPEDAELVRAILTEEWPDCEITLAVNREDFTRQLARRGAHDLILSDFTLAAFNGLEALKLARQSSPETPFIFLSGTIGEDRALEAVHSGAQDYVLKENTRRLITAIRRALRESEERRQRRAAEEALRRFAAILESTPDFVGMATADGRIFYLNQAGLGLLGRPADQDPGLLAFEDCHPLEARARLNAEIIPEALRRGSWVGENELLGPDGRRIPVSQVLIAHRARDGGVEYLSTIMRDLTAFKQAERHIREQAELIDKARDAIIVSDLDDRITFWNRGAELIFGWTAAEAVGRRNVEVLGSAVIALDEAQAALAEEDEWRGEMQLRDKQGRLLTVDKRVTMIRDDAGRPRARLSIATDITAKKQIEEQFLRAQRLESLGMLAAGIAHDLNNVLAPILMGAPMLRASLSKPGDLRLLNNLEKSAERGAGLVRQILAFAHGIGGEPQRVQVKHILRDIGAFIRQTFPKSIIFEEADEGRLWLIKANPTHIHQILLNLCVNARDAMPQGGRLRLAAENRVLDEVAAAMIEGAQPGPYLVLSVEDTGTGIPPDVLARIWDPFFTTKETSKGTGLGLSTVRGIVHAHKGFVTVETGPGRGTVFQVFLPAIDAGPEDPAAPAQSLVPYGRGELILVVDDESNIRDVTMTILAHHGYRVIGAGDGVEAATMLAPRSSEVRVVITDLQMPHLDGAALAGVVHRLNPAIKVIAVSGMESNRTLKAARHFASTFLLKPFTAEDLLVAVEKSLRESDDGPAHA